MRKARATDRRQARSVIVSGGTYGIGRGITLALAARGWQVLAFGLEARQPGSAAEKGMAGTRAALAEQGLSAELMEADVSSAADMAGVVQTARSSISDPAPPGADPGSWPTAPASGDCMR